MEQDNDMASKEFRDCGCMFQGDQEFLCGYHRVVREKRWFTLLGVEQPLGETGWLSVQIRVRGVEPNAEQCAYVQAFLELAAKGLNRSAGRVTGDESPEGPRVQEGHE